MPLLKQKHNLPSVQSAPEQGLPPVSVPSQLSPDVKTLPAPVEEGRFVDDARAAFAAYQEKRASATPQERKRSMRRAIGGTMLMAAGVYAARKYDVDLALVPNLKSTSTPPGHAKKRDEFIAGARAVKDAVGPTYARARLSLAKAGAEVNAHATRRRLATTVTSVILAANTIHPVEPAPISSVQRTAEQASEVPMPMLPQLSDTNMTNRPVSQELPQTPHVITDTTPPLPLGTRLRG